MNWRLPRAFWFILSIYSIGILFFSLFRIALLLTARASLHDVPGSIIAGSLLMGWRFDTVISGYLLVLPCTIVLLADAFGLLRKQLLRGVCYFTAAAYTIAFFMCAADIPYFQNYNSRLNISILNWTDSPLFMIRMVLQDTTFLLYLLLFFILITAYYFLFRRIYKKYIPAGTEEHPRGKRAVPGLVTWVLTTGLMILGIRGRTDEKSPIMPGTAYFSIYDLPNQAGLNPVFTFMWSYLDGLKDENKPVHLADEKQSIAFVRQALHINTPAEPGKSPIRRIAPTRQPDSRANVIVVLMESMSADYLARFGNNLQLTPNLDTLANTGYSFDAFYSAGLHTFNGIFSSLYGFPAILARHTMVWATVPHFSGLPWLMRSRGYKTVFFTTHDDQFDNMGGFLTGNGFERMLSKKDYSSGDVVSTLGVPDHVQFGRVITELNEMHTSGKPFMAAVMTVSNHQPFYVPENVAIKPRHTDVRGGTVEYADWAIGDFMSKARLQPWYKNTIFVFLGDHGTNDGTNIGGLPYGYSHIPCLIYSPLLQEHRNITTPGGQPDLYPTVAGLLGGTYINNTLGIDLLHETRPYMYFGQDDKIGVADGTSLYIWHTDGSEQMLNLSNHQDIMLQHRSKADSMRTYGLSMVQVYQWLLDHKLTRMEKN